MVSSASGHHSWGGQGPERHQAAPPGHTGTPSALGNPDPVPGLSGSSRSFCVSCLGSLGWVPGRLRAGWTELLNGPPAARGHLEHQGPITGALGFCRVSWRRLGRGAPPVGPPELRVS